MNGDIDRDALYRRRVLPLLRAWQADMRYDIVVGELPEEVSGAQFEEYITYKKWASFMAAGDRRSALYALENPKADLTERGDLFPFNSPSNAMLGREPAPPDARGVLAWRRAHIGAIAGMAEARRDGALGEGPSEKLRRLQSVVSACFGGRVSSDPILVIARRPHTPPPTRENLIARVSAPPVAPLPSDWEARLPESLPGMVCRVYERMEALPHSTDLAALVRAVRVGLGSAWPSGALDAAALSDLMHRFGLTDRPQTRDVLSVAVSYCAAKLHRLRTPWLLADGDALARQQAESKIQAYGLPDEAVPTSASVAQESAAAVAASGDGAKSEVPLYGPVWLANGSPKLLAPLLRRHSDVDDEDGSAVPRGISFDPEMLMYEPDLNRDTFGHLAGSIEDHQRRFPLDFARSRADLTPAALSRWMAAHAVRRPTMGDFKGVPGSHEAWGVALLPERHS